MQKVKPRGVAAGLLACPPPPPERRGQASKIALFLNITVGAVHGVIACT